MNAQHKDQHLYTSLRSKAKSDLESSLILQALCDTLDHFKVRLEHREVLAEAILRLIMLQVSKDKLQPEPTDSKVMTLWKVMEYFQRLCNERKTAQES